MTIVSGTFFMASGTLVFALSDSAATLITGRVIQGFGSGAAWIGSVAWLLYLVPVERRSEGIGWIAAAGMLGVVIGPMVGALAEAFGRSGVFFVLAAIFSSLTLAFAMLPSGSRVYPNRVGSIRETLVDDGPRTGIAILTLAGVALGVLGLLVPLDLDARGFSATTVAGIFAFASLLQALLSPLVGMWFDRAGARAPIVIGSFTMVGALLLASTIGPYAIWAVVALVTGGALFWVPAITLALGSHDRDPLLMGLACGTVVSFAAYSSGSLVAGWLLESDARWAALGITAAAGASAGLVLLRPRPKGMCSACN